MQGWIKLHRKILNSPLYQQLNSKQRDVMITLLLLASHETNEWEFGGQIYKVEPGQLVTSLESLKRYCASDVSIQNIRTTLLKLERHNFLTNKSTNRNRLITIVNWANYQSVDEELTSKLNSNQQTTNKQLTTIKKERRKEVNNNISSSRNKPKVYSEDDKYYRMAVYFHNRVKEVAALNNKEHLVRDANLQRWADEFRKIVELDKRDTKELKQIIDWATSDPFWQTNILSPSKLRKQYVNLAMQMSRPRQSGEKKNKMTSNLVFLRAQLEGGERDEQTGSQFAIDQSISSLPPFRS